MTTMWHNVPFLRNCGKVTRLLQLIFIKVCLNINLPGFLCITLLANKRMKIFCSTIPFYVIYIHFKWDWFDFQLLNELMYDVPPRLLTYDMLVQLSMSAASFLFCLCHCCIFWNQPGMILLAVYCFIMISPKWWRPEYSWRQGKFVGYQ